MSVIKPIKKMGKDFIKTIDRFGNRVVSAVPDAGKEVVNVGKKARRSFT